jgi:four helix bundle protein
MLEKHRVQKVKLILGIKCKIAYKEAQETEYWLTLCKHAKNYPFEEELYDYIKSIIKVLGKIISSTH